MNRTRTNTWIRISQVAAGAGVVGAGLAAAFVGHTPAPVPPAVVELPAFTPIDDPSSPQTSTASTPGVATRLALIANKPKPAAVTAPPPGPPPPPPPPPAPSVTYHGMVLGSAPLALVKDGSKQMFVKVGDIVQGKAVELIEAEQIRLGPVDGGMVVPLSGRTGGPVTIANAPAPEADPNPRLATRNGEGRKEKFDFESMLNPKAQTTLVPTYVDAEDAIYFLFARSRLAQTGQYGPGELDKLAFDQLQNNRDDFRKLAERQLGEERVQELVKTEALRQEEMRKRMNELGFDANDPASLEKFYQQGVKP